MAKGTEKTNRAQQVLTEMHQVRATASRKDAVARLKAIAADLDGDGADNEKAHAARAIKALSAAYERTGDLVPDRLWADAVNLTPGRVRRSDWTEPNPLVTLSWTYGELNE
jgi:hypothetical protein